MRIRQYLAMGLVVMLATQAAWSADPPPPPLTLNGRVVDMNDQPVAGAGVVMLGARRDASGGMQIDLLLETKAGDDGAFQDTLTDASGYERVLVAARREGYAIGSWNGAMAELPQALNLRMGEPQKLAGVVVDPSGQPILNATVKLMLHWQAEGRSCTLLGHESIPELMVNTDQQGRFEIDAVPEGALACFAVVADDYASTVWPAASPSVPAGSEDLSISMSPGAEISGTVRCANADRSLKGLTIVASLNEMGFLTDRRAETDSAGRFTVTGLPVGKVRLVVLPEKTAASDATPANDLPWLGQAETLVLKPGQAPADLSIELQQASVLEVSVLNRSKSEPVTDAQVYVQDQQHTRVYNAQTDMHGIARIQAFPGGYTVYAQHPDYLQTGSRQFANADQGQTQPVQLWLTQAMMLTGAVVDQEAQPLAGVEVQLMPSNGQSSTVTDADGRFSLKWEPVEWGMDVTSVLVMRHPYTEQALAIPIDDPAMPVNVTLAKASTCSGRVLTDQGEPLAGATITVSMQSDSWGSQLQDSNQVTTDEQGRFSVNTLPQEMDYTITATAKGYGRHPWRVEYAQPGETTLEDARLIKADQQLSGMIVDNTGKPVANARIQVSGDQQPQQHTTSDAEGKFTILGLCPGYVNLYAYTNQPHMYGQMYATVGRGDVTITVASSGSFGEPPDVPVPQPLKGQPMPDLSTLDLEPAPSGQPTLVVFIDARQRPSRHALRQLQAQAGMSTSAHVVVAQLGQVDDALLDELDITLPLTRVDDAVDECRLQWGVPGLPWYVLADPSGKVVHSGPSLSPSPDTN